MTSLGAAPAHDASAGMLLTLLGRASNRLVADALRPIGLKPRHLAALSELREGPMTQQALGEATKTDPTKLVGLLNDLETWALVVRRRDPVDRRRHIVEISACGRERLAQVDRLVAESDRRLLAGLDDDQRSMLVELLTRVAVSGGIAPTCASMVETDDDPDGDAGV